MINESKVMIDRILLVAMLLAAAVNTIFAGNAPVEPKVVEFPLSSVRLHELSPFTKAMQIDRTYLLSLNYDRLLSHMRKSAGLTPKAPPYGNWEGKSWTIGHAMSALSMHYAATGDKEALDKLNYAVEGVAECQKPDTGFIAQNDWCRKMYEDIANDPRKDEKPTNRWQVFGIKEYKVPFYYVHKLNAGLLDAWRYAGNEKARAAFLKHCDWLCSYMDRFTDQQFENVLYVEHGGLNETLAEAAALASDKAAAEKYLRNAKKFSHKEMLVALAKGEDILPKLHANTQIPKFVGFRRIADLTQDQQYADAARNFWNIVVETQTFSLGGNSIGEHFPEANQFEKALARTAGPETCNSYNMLKLTEGLFRAEPVARYADYYERTMYNHILSSQDNDSPEGGFVYYTQLRPLSYRVFSKVHEHFWCCVGTGLENHVKYGKFLYAHSANALYVNLFVPSTVVWKEKDITLAQKTRFPSEEGIQFTIQTPKESVEFTLRIRKPEWVAGNALAVSVNGAKESLTAADDGYIALTRAWKNGDAVSVSLPMRIRVESLKGAAPFYAMLYGPILLAQRNGTQGVPAFKWIHQHTGNGLNMPIGNMPFLKVSPQDLPSRIRKNDGEKLSFKIDPAIIDKADAIELVPFNEIYEERYAMYFPVGDDKVLAAYRDTYKMLESSDREKVLARAVDSMIFGWQQPETDHKVKAGKESWVGYFRDELPFRSAKDWFAAMFAAPEGQFQKGMKLAVFTEIHGAITGRAWEIAVNGQTIATETLKEKLSDKLEIREYPIPQEIVDASNGMFEVKITCREKEAGPIFKMGIVNQVMWTPPMYFGDSDRIGHPFAKDPSVIRFGGRYLMYYSIAAWAKELTPPGAPRGWAIGIAESRDLVNWKKIGEILPEQACEKNGIVNGRIILLDGKLHLFYNTYGNGAKDALCHATSEDGLHFTRNPTNPIWHPTGDWNNGRAIDVDVVEWGGKLIMYYATRDPAGKIQMLHAIAAPRKSGFNRDDWKSLCDGPVLKPELPWEKTCIEAPSVIKRGDTLYLFYGGGYNNAPQQIGCAMSKDGIHFERLFIDKPLLPNGAPGEWNSSESGHPGMFEDDDGQLYMFYQANNDQGRTWFISKVEIGWDGDKPKVIQAE